MLKYLSPFEENLYLDYSDKKMQRTKTYDSVCLINQRRQKKTLWLSLLAVATMTF